MIQLPTKITKKRLNVPKTMLIYGSPKSGKTTICSKLEDSLLIEFEDRGADFIEGMILECTKPFRFDNGKIIPVVNDIEDAIKTSKKRYKYIIIDTLTKLDEWSEIYGTYRYMDTTQGKTFNRKNNIAGAEKIYHNNEAFETVHELPNGNGYYHSRKVLVDLWFEKLSLLADHVIFLAHIKDKFIGTAVDGTKANTTEINLTGQTKNIIPSRVDAVAQLKVKKNQRVLVFNSRGNIEAGSRCEHLQDEVVISEKEANGEIKTYWDKVFNPNKKGG